MHVELAKLTAAVSTASRIDWGIWVRRIRLHKKPRECYMQEHVKPIKAHSNLHPMAAFHLRPQQSFKFL